MKSDDLETVLCPSPSFPKARPNLRLSGVTLRPTTLADLPLLERLYASARALEMSQVDWPQSDKEAFLHQQFEAQHRYYQQHYPDAFFEVIECDGASIGRLYHQWRTSELRLMDIALLPEWRQRGIGTSLVKALMQEAADRHLAIVLHVEPYNPAVGWYQRLGFAVHADNGVYLQMRWSVNAEAHHPGA